MRQQDRIEQAISHAVKATMLLAANEPERVVQGPEFNQVAAAATQAISNVFEVADSDDGAFLRIAGSEVDFQPFGMSSEQLGLILQARITKVVRDAIGKVYQEAGAL